MHQFYCILTFIIYTNICTRKLAGNIFMRKFSQSSWKTALTTIIMLRSSSVFFKCRSSVIIVWVIIYWFNKITDFFHSSSCFFSVSFLSLIGTSVKYLFPLISSTYYLFYWWRGTKDLHYEFLGGFWSSQTQSNNNIFVRLFIYLDFI